MIWGQKKSKYMANTTHAYGRLFASKAEAMRYSELYLLEKAGEISELRMQVDFPLKAPENSGLYSDAVRTEKGAIMRYRADFVYIDASGKKVVEDVKGFPTPEFKIKRELMRMFYGINIRVLKRKKGGWQSI